MKHYLALLAGLLCTISLSGQNAKDLKKSAGSPNAPAAVNKAAVEAYVRHLFVWGPNITVSLADPRPSPLRGFWEVAVTGSAGQASQTELFHVSPDGSQLLRGAIFDLADNPFAAEVKKLRIEGEPFTGPPAASVTVVMFSDFQCGYCREEAMVLKENVRKAYADRVKLVYRDYPLEQIHPWARKASITGRCVFRQNAPAFWTFHDWIFESQPNITDENFKGKFIEFASGQKWDVDKLTACIDLRTTGADVDRNIADAQLLGLNSTPTLYVNGRKMVGRVEWANLKQVIDHEIDYARLKSRVGKGGS